MAWEPCKTKDGKHNFANGVCLNECGLNQSDLIQKKTAPLAFELKTTPAKKGAHNYDISLCIELWELLGKKERVGKYIGIMKNKGPGFIKTWISDIREGRA